MIGLRVNAGIFHDFHRGWVESIKRAMNGGVLPSDYYALAEQITGNLGPDVLTPYAPGGSHAAADEPRGSTALASRPPKTRFHVTAEEDAYASKANEVVIHQVSNHEVVAIVKVVSPGNKGSRRAIDAFVRKAQDALAAGIHLLIVDFFPPGRRDPDGIHPAIWQGRGGPFEFSAAKPLTCAAYVVGLIAEAFVQPVAVGEAVPDMPLFLTPDSYVDVPLASTYQTVWEGVPYFWQNALTSASDA